MAFKVFKLELEPILTGEEGEIPPASASERLDAWLVEDGLELISASVYVDPMAHAPRPWLVCVAREIALAPSSSVSGLSPEADREAYDAWVAGADPSDPAWAKRRVTEPNLAASAAQERRNLPA